MSAIKICKICNSKKDLCEFPKGRARCKLCFNKHRRKTRNYSKEREYNKNWKKNNPDKVKECRKKHYKKNKKNILEKHKIYSEKNKDKIAEKHREYAIKNKEKLNKYKKKWANKNREKVREQKANYKKRNKEKIWKYEKERRKNIHYRINTSMSSSIRKALAGNKNGLHWENLVNYSLDDLKNHLESLFEPWMNWENYGVYRIDGPRTWQIDHIIPKSWFKYKSYEDPEFKECWKLSNLQPKCSYKNNCKQNKYIG